MIEFTTLLLASALCVGFYMAWNIGANDVANAMGTSVGSGALTLRRAVLVAAVLEFGGAFCAGSDVSETVMRGIVEPEMFAAQPLFLAYGMLASALAAGAWLQLASYFGWPVSTTHSIIGAILGFGMIHGGLEAINWEQVGWIVSSWVVSPLLGGILAFLLFSFMSRFVFYSARPVRQVKKLVPFVVLVVFSVLATFVVYKLSDSFHWGFSPRALLALSVLCGAFFSIVSYFAIQRVPEVYTEVPEEERFDPSLLVSLRKAEKHLGRAKSSSAGQLKFRVSQMRQELKDIAGELQKERERDPQVQRSEYQTVERVFMFLQILTASMMAFAHGANDVANAIGPIAAIVNVVNSGSVAVSGEIPTWILTLGGAGIVIGLATWGWRVIETVGKKITELTPSRGFAAEFGAAVTILLASKLGLPISTTHTLIGAILGIGLARGIEAINLMVVRDIVASWVITIPAGAGLSIFFFKSLKFFLA